MICGKGKFNKFRANNYLTCTNDCGVNDLGFVSPKYTWSNSSRTLEKLIQLHLDRAWVNIDWLHTFLEAKLFHLDRWTSDHFP